MSAGPRVAADRDVCVGSGNCVRIAPEVFDQDDAEGLVVVRRAEVEPGQDGAVRDAERNCPSGAISLTSPDNPPPAR